MMQPLFFEPVFKEMVWGGDRLHTEYGYRTPSDHTGECWGISAHPHGDCVVLGGPYAGQRLSELWESHRELFGHLDAPEFPLLVKIIDAREDLSVQVHPDDAYAQAQEGQPFGKTECWYVLDAAPGTTIIIGHRARSREELSDMVTGGRFSDLLREIPVKRGDFFQIDPGTLHAIRGGTMILETQQNSDLTYRVYDYDRLYQGKKRELHLAKSLDVLGAAFTDVADACPEGDTPGMQATFVSTEPATAAAGTFAPFADSDIGDDDASAKAHGSPALADSSITRLVRCPYYTVWQVAAPGELALHMDAPFLCVSIIDGDGTLCGFPKSARQGDKSEAPPLKTPPYEATHLETPPPKAPPPKTPSLKTPPYEATHLETPPPETPPPEMPPPGIPIPIKKGDHFILPWNGEGGAGIHIEGRMTWIASAVSGNLTERTS
ncbi:MAG: class I mannose-6-phosphate isomerase [Lachnospiraceae bacterium]|jgi:mannose-6-phosphate isomerase class I|nr:class I mannose-6-phosphate isomerase [Lachnospiraceae bacterium]